MTLFSSRDRECDHTYKQIWLLCVLNFTFVLLRGRKLHLNLNYNKLNHLVLFTRCIPHADLNKYGGYAYRN